MLAGGRGRGRWNAKWLLMSHLSAFDRAAILKSLPRRYFGHEMTRARSTRPNMDILDAGMLTNIVFLLHLPFKVSQGATRAECVSPCTCCYCCCGPPAWLSWENTESGSGSWRSDLSLWTPEGPQGPSGFRQTYNTHQSRAWSWNAGASFLICADICS